MKSRKYAVSYRDHGYGADNYNKIWIGYQELNEPYRRFYASSKYPDKTLGILGDSFTFTHLNMDADAYITTTVNCEARCKAWNRELSEVKITVGKSQACDYIEIQPIMSILNAEKYEAYPINIEMPESLIENTTNGLPRDA